MNTTQTTRPAQTIKMMAFNGITRQWNEVFPEDGVAVARMVPKFWSMSDQDWYSVPDCAAADVHAEWLQQVA